MIDRKILKSLILLLLITLNLTLALPASASEFCRQIEGKEICIVAIKRSAKNYWEYRAKVRIDGAVRPQQIYNCRRRIRVQKDGSAIRFSSGGAGEFICSYFQK